MFGILYPQRNRVMPVTHFASLPIRSVTIVRWVGLSIALSLNAVTALAGAPRLAFDFGRTAECRDVTQELSLIHI